MKADVTVTVDGSAPYLLRTQGLRRLQSLGYFAPQLLEHPEAFTDAVDRAVDGPQSLLRDREGAEVDDAHERLGRLIGESIDLAMVRVRG